MYRLNSKVRLGGEAVKMYIGSTLRLGGGVAMRVWG